VCWKISIIAELFGGRSGLGYMMQWAQDFGSVDSIIAICLAIVFFVMIGDALILRPLSRLFQPDVAPARRSLFAMALKTISVRGQSA
jgi:ABC-type nitrate/sulfonate/bicarbonate transport system permease component